MYGFIPSLESVAKKNARNAKFAGVANASQWTRMCTYFAYLPGLLCHISCELTGPNSGVWTSIVRIFSIVKVHHFPKGDIKVYLSLLRIRTSTGRARKPTARTAHSLCSKGDVKCASALAYPLFSKYVFAVSCGIPYNIYNAYYMDAGDMAAGGGFHERHFTYG